MSSARYQESKIAINANLKKKIELASIEERSVVSKLHAIRCLEEQQSLLTEIKKSTVVQPTIEAKTVITHATVAKRVVGVGPTKQPVTIYQLLKYQAGLKAVLDMIDEPSKNSSKESLEAQIEEKLKAHKEFIKRAQDYINASLSLLFEQPLINVSEKFQSKKYWDMGQIYYFLFEILNLQNEKKDVTEKMNQFAKFLEKRLNILTSSAEISYRDNIAEFKKINAPKEFLNSIEADIELLNRVKDNIHKSLLTLKNIQENFRNTVLHTQFIATLQNIANFIIENYLNVPSPLLGVAQGSIEEALCVSYKAFLATLHQQLKKDINESLNKFHWLLLEDKTKLFLEVDAKEDRPKKHIIRKDEFNTMIALSKAIAALPKSPATSSVKNPSAFDFGKKGQLLTTPTKIRPIRSAREKTKSPKTLEPVTNNQKRLTR